MFDSAILLALAASPNRLIPLVRRALRLASGPGHEEPRRQRGRRGWTSVDS